jgi:hypothetical protein
MPLYRTRPTVVDAIQITHKTTISPKVGDALTGCPGDWLITETEGQQYFCHDGIFQATYVEQDTQYEDAPVGEIPYDPLAVNFDDCDFCLVNMDDVESERHPGVMELITYYECALKKNGMKCLTPQKLCKFIKQDDQLREYFMEATAVEFAEDGADVGEE